MGTEIVFDTVFASLAFCAVMAAALGYQWRTSRQAYLGCWAAFWSLYVVVWAVVVPAYGDGAGPVTWTAVAVATGGSLLARSLLALGTALHLGKPRPSRRALAVGALAVLAVAAAVTGARAAADLGAVPRWAVLPLRPYSLGFFLNAALAILVVRWRRASPGKGRLLFALAFVAGAASDAWDVALEVSRDAGWVIPPDLDLRLSAIGSHLCDALFATGMMVAAIATERERAETAAAEVRARDARLLHAERLETVGQLAGGLAHDFNNLLTAILASLSALRERTPPGDPALEDLDIATGAADRASRLIRQLLTFARRQPVEPRRLDLNEALTAAAPLVASLAGTAVARRLELAAAPWTVRVDPVQLEQALVNARGRPRPGERAPGAPARAAGAVRDGYAAGVLGPAELGGGPTALLLKPFAPDALAARLRELLDGAGAA